MITREEAYQKAKHHIEARAPVEIVIPEDEIEDHGWCWVFYYNSRAAIETGDWRKGLIGNAPRVVVKETGDMYVTGTAYPVEYFLEEIRQGRKRPIDDL